MTNRKSERSDRPRGLTARRTTAALAALGAGLIATTMTGCGGDEEQVAAPVQVQQPRQVETRATLEGVAMDARVQFPGERLPRSQQLAEAVAALASALAAGDEFTMMGMLDGPSEAILASLLESGDWDKETGNLEAVRVVALEEDSGVARVGLAVQDAAGAYLLGWQGRDVGGRWIFSGLPVAGVSGARASDLDDASLASTVIAGRKSTAHEPQLAEPEQRTPTRPGAAPGSRSPSRPAPSDQPMAPPVSPL